MLFAGWALYAQRPWAARDRRSSLAMLSAIANFFFIPYYPFWSILVIALDVWVHLGADAAERRPNLNLATTRALPPVCLEAAVLWERSWLRSHSAAFSALVARTMSVTMLPQRLSRAGPSSVPE